ncbi:MAG: MipA/OmpV family protein, partial [Nitrospinota bacterium]|nr:MipA/OmpV family protein [Nitrospinota bacterium]
KTYFSITPTQSDTTGISAYDSGGGIKDIGVGAALKYDWDAHWILKGKLAFTRLLGDARDSPLANSETGRGSENQFKLGMFIAYRF